MPPAGYTPSMGPVRLTSMTPKAAPPPPKAAVAPPTSTRTGNNPRGVAISPAGPTYKTSTLAKSGEGGRSATTARLAKSLALYHQQLGYYHQLTGASTGRQDNAYLSLMKSDFSKLKAEGFFNGQFPNVNFMKSNPIGGSTFVTGLGGGVGTPGRTPTVNVPTGFGASAANAGSRNPYGGYTRAAAVHEMAHTQQNQEALSSPAMREGGAQAFAMGAAPMVDPKSSSGTNPGVYRDYVAQMFARMPPQWFMRNQFIPGKKAPPINMPTTSAGGTSLKKVLDMISMALPR